MDNKQKSESLKMLMKKSNVFLTGAGTLVALTWIAFAGGPAVDGANGPGKSCQNCQKPGSAKVCESEALTQAEPASAEATAEAPPRGGMRGRGGRGMSQEAHETIHSLFTNHDQFNREVKLTEDGYVSKTTSDNPEMAKMIQSHVRQMEARLDKGLMVRRWDPAYEEFVRHYDDVDIRIQKIENGIQVTAIGKTEEAVKVARNHAGIVSRFVAHGWEEHDVAHPTAADKDTTPAIEGLKASSEANVHAITELLELGKTVGPAKTGCRSESGKECCLKNTPVQDQ